MLRLLVRCHALRRPKRFGLTLLACKCNARGRLDFQDRNYPQRPALSAALLAALVTEAVARV